MSKSKPDPDPKFYAVKAVRIITVWYPHVEAESIEAAREAVERLDSRAGDFEEMEGTEVYPVEVYFADQDDDCGYSAGPLWQEKPEVREV